MHNERESRFGGQSFIENTYAKVKKLKELITIKGVYDYRSGRWRNQQNAKQLGSRPMCLLLEAIYSKLTTLLKPSPT
jgi:hypothetical protein